MPRDLPVVDPPRDAPDGEGIHGVVLAAGTSSRYGDRNKLLEPVEGEPMVRRAVRTLRDSVLDDVTVVVGHEAERVRAALADCGVSIRHNGAFARGQSTSVAEGVRAARGAGARAVLIALGDMPYVSPGTVDLLVAAYEAGAATALAAACDGRRGNPVLFDARYFDALADVEGDTGGREILRTDPGAAAVETGDRGVLTDIDRPEER